MGFCWKCGGVANFIREGGWLECGRPECRKSAGTDTARFIDAVQPFLPAAKPAGVEGALYADLLVDFRCWWGSEIGDSVVPPDNAVTPHDDTLRKRVENWLSARNDGGWTRPIPSAAKPKPDDGLRWCSSVGGTHATRLREDEACRDCAVAAGFAAPVTRKETLVDSLPCGCSAVRVAVLGHAGAVTCKPPVAAAPKTAPAPPPAGEPVWGIGTDDAVRENEVFRLTMQDDANAGRGCTMTGPGLALRETVRGCRRCRIRRFGMHCPGCGDPVTSFELRAGESGW